MSSLKIKASKSGSYAVRTKEVVSFSDISLLLNINPKSAGARCTYGALKSQNKPFEDVFYHNGKPVESALALDNALKNIETFSKNRDTTIINTAGNGISTWAIYYIPQIFLNELMYDKIDNLSLDKTKVAFISGGQTGVDLAGSVAAYILGYETRILLPAGYKIRTEDNTDIWFNNEEAFKKFFMKEVSNTKAHLNLDI
jgi:hypothetical protein